MQRFWDKTLPEPNTGCWLWLGKRGGGGYGLFSIDARWHRAHRVALELSGHFVPNESVVCHRCDNPSCVNPDHLYVGTQRENARDRERRGRGGGPSRRGAGNGRAKLTNEQVAEIRAAFGAGGASKRALGKMFGVSDVQIGNIVRGLQW